MLPRRGNKLKVPSKGDCESKLGYCVGYIRELRKRGRLVVIVRDNEGEDLTLMMKPIDYLTNPTVAY